MRENTIKKIIEFFEENTDLFNNCIEELDSYNGYLGDDRCCPMEMLNDFYASQQPIDILYRAYYGRDDDTWHTDANGDKIYGEFNPNREYFYYNGYGNLVSTDYPDYSYKLDEYAIEEMSENRSYIDTIEDNDELSALFDELEEDDEQ